MPRGRRGARAGRVRVAFRALITTASVTSGSTAVSPASFGRLSSIQDSWLQYRFTRLKVAIQPTSTGSNDAACYVPNGVTTLPTTIGTVMEVLPSALQSKNDTAPRSFVVPRSTLQGQILWYDANAGSSIAATQGTIAYASDVASILQITVEGICEFQGPVDPANTPEVRQALRVAALARRREVAKVEVSEFLKKMELFGEKVPLLGDSPDQPPLSPASDSGPTSASLQMWQSNVAARQIYQRWTADGRQMTVQDLDLFPPELRACLRAIARL